MAKQKKTRKELLRGPDEFLTFSSRVAAFVRDHSREFSYLVLAIAVIAVAYLAVGKYLGHVNKTGQEAYNRAYDSIADNIKADDGDLKNLQKSEELFVKVMDEYGLSKAARLALPQVAFMKFIDNEYDEAISLYKKFSDLVSDDIQYRSMTSLALAACYEAKGDLKTAIETLKPVVGAIDAPFREAAMFDMARLFRLDNSPEKSKEILKQLVEEYPDSPFLPIAKAHL